MTEEQATTLIETVAALAPKLDLLQDTLTQVLRGQNYLFLGVAACLFFLAFSALRRK